MQEPCTTTGSPEPTPEEREALERALAASLADEPSSAAPGGERASGSP